MGVALPPGFTVVKKGVALPPGFKVVQPAGAAPPAQPYQPDPALAIPTGQTVNGQWQPDGGVTPGPAGITAPPATSQPSTDYGRDIKIGAQGDLEGLGGLVGLPVDLTNGAINLAGGAYDALPLPDLGIRGSPEPFGGSKMITDALMNLIPGGPIKQEDMNPYQRVGEQINNFATQGLLGGAALGAPAVRAAATAAKSPFMEALTHPYTTGSSAVSDAVAGGGAGAGSGLYDEFAPDSVKKSWFGPIGQVLAMLGGATGTNLAEAMVRGGANGVKSAADTMWNGGNDTALPPNPDGTFVKKNDADVAASIVQANAANPTQAAETIKQSSQNLAPFAEPAAQPTAGLLSNDPGLVSLEQAQRLDPSMRVPFTLRDQAVERAALGNAKQTAPEGSSGREFTDTVEQQHAARVAAAQDQVQSTGQAQQQLDAIMQQQALDLASKGGKAAEARASTGLDEAITPTLTAAQKAKNDAFAGIDPAGVEYRDPSGLLDTVDQIEMQHGPLSDPGTVPGDWMQRIRALVDEKGNVSQVSFKDLNAIRPQLSEQITAAQKAGNYTLADNLRSIKGVIDTETERLAQQGGDAGFRAKSALAQYAKFADVWAVGPGDAAQQFRKDFNLDRNNRTTTPPSQTAGRFLQPGQPERVASLKRVLNGDPKGAQAAGEYLSADLASAPGVIVNGKINPAGIRTWMANWGDEAIGLSPDFKKQLDDLLAKGDVNAADATVLGRQLKDAVEQVTVQKQDSDAIRKVLGNDPVNAVASIFASGDPERTVKTLMGEIAGNESATNGLRAAIRDYILERATTSGISRTGTGENPLSFAKLDDLFKKHENVLAEIYTPEQMNYLRASHQLLAPLKNLELRTVTGSQTSASDKMWERIAKPLEVGLKLRFGILKGGGLMRTINLWRTMLPDSETAAKQLISRMYFDPELAQQLLTRNVSAVGSSGYNARLIRLLTYGSASANMVER